MNLESYIFQCHCTGQLQFFSLFLFLEGRFVLVLSFSRHAWVFLCLVYIVQCMYVLLVKHFIHRNISKGEAHFEFLTFDTHRFQIGHFCFNLLLTGIVQPHSVLTWHCFVWTQFCCTLLSLTQFWLSLVEPRLSSAALTSVSLTLG